MSEDDLDYADIVIRRLKLELAEAETKLKAAQAKLAYYEAPLGLGTSGFDHRFNEYGTCIRCGEDAEEWDAGCVEEIADEALGWEMRNGYLESEVKELKNGSIRITPQQWATIKEMLGFARSRLTYIYYSTIPPSIEVKVAQIDSALAAIRRASEAEGS